MISLKTVTDFLDRELKLASFHDDSHNGLQVEAPGPVRRICTGVDASLAFFEKAAERRADLVICHHGLSWGDSLKRITGLNYRRLRFLIEHRMALYACHLPLDAHPALGNNAQIAKSLGLRQIRPFGQYHGMTIGCQGLLPAALSVARFQAGLERLLGRPAQTMAFGKPRVRRVAVVSGGAADLVAEAGAIGLDAFVSGEPQLQAFALAQEYGIHAFFGGHYATEVFGVKALAARLQARFRVQACFVPMEVPY